MQNSEKSCCKQRRKLSFEMVCTAKYLSKYSLIYGSVMLASTDYQRLPDFCLLSPHIRAFLVLFTLPPSEGSLFLSPPIRGFPISLTPWMVLPSTNNDDLLILMIVFCCQQMLMIKCPKITTLYNTCWMCSEWNMYTILLSCHSWI